MTEEIDTTLPRFRDREAEAEIRRIEGNRARCPRLAAILDEIAPAIDGGHAPMHVQLVDIFLGSRLSRGFELTEEHEALVRRVLSGERL